MVNIKNINTIDKQIEEAQDFLNSKYKELDDILNSNNINENYIDFLNYEIDILEKELNMLKNKNKYKSNIEKPINNKILINNENNDIKEIVFKDKKLENINNKENNNIYILKNLVNNMENKITEDSMLIKEELNKFIKSDNKNKNHIIEIKKDINNILYKVHLFKNNLYDYINK